MHHPSFSLKKWMQSGKDPGLVKEAAGSAYPEGFRTVFVITPGDEFMQPGQEGIHREPSENIPVRIKAAQATAVGADPDHSVPVLEQPSHRVVEDAPGITGNTCITSEQAAEPVVFHQPVLERPDPQVPIPVLEKRGDVFVRIHDRGIGQEMIKAGEVVPVVPADARGKSKPHETLRIFQDVFDISGADPVGRGDLPDPGKLALGKNSYYRKKQKDQCKAYKI
jgi:hypothetical protein